MTKAIKKNSEQPVQEDKNNIVTSPGEIPIDQVSEDLENNHQEETDNNPNSEDQIDSEKDLNKDKEDNEDSNEDEDCEDSLEEEQASTFEAQPNEPQAQEQSPMGLDLDGKIDFENKQFVLIPTTESMVFPSIIYPLSITNENVLNSLEYAIKNNLHILLMLQKNPQVENPERKDLHTIGMVCNIIQAIRIPNGPIKVMVQGNTRARLSKIISKVPVTVVTAKPVDEITADEELLSKTKQVIDNQFRQVASLRQLPSEMVSAILAVENYGHLADIIAFNLDITPQQKQTILETKDLGERLKKVSQHLSREIEVLKIESRIRHRAELEMAKGHKDYFLRRKLKAIQEELGEEDDEKEEITHLAEEIKNANMPEYAEKHALKELKKMERMMSHSPDRSVIHTYLDWMLQFPWSKTTEDRLDINEALKILNEDHYGLKDVKERMLEFLSVRKLKESHRGPILCFVGPPGVGKTSLGRSIAKTLGRKFNRTSLGGVRDEAEIRGHRRTYVGALPGRIIQSLCTAESLNSVIMLDEIDKIGSDFRGDPSAALLEALDPEQNHEFKDHYMSVPVDLSSTMFILTANVLDTIPPALRDRMEVIRIPGYTVEEKIEIAKQFLVPRVREQHGLSEKQFSVEEEALLRIVREYTKEAGVRNLEREIARLCRKIARKVAEAKKTPKKLATIEAKDIDKLLGTPRFSAEKKKEHHPTPGCVTGLSWTQVGGETLTIESLIIPGRGKLLLTGSLGKVMKESAKTAISWVRNYLQETGVEFRFYRNDIHVHVPEGAIPKDGPSAGITLAVSFLSAVLKRPCLQNVAMTGEMTLTGKVMPVGGIKEKVLAAYNADIFEIIMPKENEKNIEDIDEKIRSKMHFHFVEHVKEVIDLVMPTSSVTQEELASWWND